jgi:UDP-N-acetylglucosamine diphosphorylase/glucosamine-1-phosphate N-acetyltransferase
LNPLAILVLAAGKGKRMHSDLPKVLHPFAETPIIEHLLNATSSLNAESTVVVVGHQADRVREALKDRNVGFVDQVEQLGTGHAVMESRSALDGFSGTLVVLVGDVPLLTEDTLTSFVAHHRSTQAACTLLTTRLKDPSGYGRICRNAESEVQAIVEHKDATPDQLKIDEINSGIMAFETAPLWTHISDLKPANVQAEYYLTDLVGIFKGAGLKVSAWCVEDDHEVQGVNSPEQLAALERIFYARARPIRD